MNSSVQDHKIQSKVDGNEKIEASTYREKKGERVSVVCERDAHLRCEIDAMRSKCKAVEKTSSSSSLHSQREREKPIYIERMRRKRNDLKRREKKTHAVSIQLDWFFFSS